MLTLLFLFPTDDFCVHDWMNVSHTTGVKVLTFICAAAAAELLSWTRWIEMDSFAVALWHSKHLCELSKLHLLYLSVSLIPGT